MKVVLAALDGGPAARPVLEAALGIGQLTAATVEAVHVREDSADTPEGLTAHAGVPLRLAKPPVTESLLAAVSQPEVAVAVFGARAIPGGRRPVGHTALHVLERAEKPIVVVPPEAVGVSPRPFRRLLVPLEGSEESSRPVGESLRPLIASPIELIVLHVFTAATVPRTLDRPARDLSLWADEFLARFCPTADRIELRTGPVGGRVADVCASEDIDLVVLSWSRDVSTGHAAVIRDVLGDATIPVLLLPVR
jgi:Universal stress protein family